MTNLILEAISTALFAQFFTYAIHNVPYLTWYGNLLNKISSDAINPKLRKNGWYSWISDPLGNCPYCIAPWLFLILHYVPIPEEIKEVCFAFGWIYFANACFNRFIDND